MKLWKQLFLKHFSQNMLINKELDYLGTVKQGYHLFYKKIDQKWHLTITKYIGWA